MCIICMEDMGETECKLKCGHSYHFDCIRECICKRKHLPGRRDSVKIRFNSLI